MAEAMGESKFSASVTCWGDCGYVTMLILTCFCWLVPFNVKVAVLSGFFWF